MIVYCVWKAVASFVRTGLGATELMQMPSSPIYTICYLLSRINADFDVPLAKRRVDAREPEIEAIFTILPFDFLNVGRARVTDRRYHPYLSS